ncbi:MAG TPA: 50S ribosomal protein L3 [Chloroflexota bacterium]|nr:50S ribosomal protein L3 [Chloroflexota bacterium]
MSQTFTEGLLGRKLGMTQIFEAGGVVRPVTAIQAGPCTVTQVKTPDRDGYSAIQIGFGAAKKLNKPEAGHLRELPMLRYLREVRLDSVGSYEQGQQIDASLFEAGELVDVVGTSKGKGFAGGVKRHHFRGGPKTHGQSDRHRAPGSVGATTTPGRVYKGTRMAGHMGDVRVTVQNLTVVEVDTDRNLLLVEGAVPGADNGLVFVRKAVKAAGRKKQA